MTLPFNAPEYEILKVKDLAFLRELLFSIPANMHPYERLFAALRDKRDFWKLDRDGCLRRDGLCPLAVACGGCDDVVDDDAMCCLGMTEEQLCFVVLSADGVSYADSGYEDLSRKLQHYLGAT